MSLLRSQRNTPGWGYYVVGISTTSERTGRSSSYLDARYTRLTCRKHFDNRSDFFRHIDAAAHAMDPYTKKREHYTRPESARHRDNEDYKDSDAELGAWLDARYTCFACRKHFPARSDLFEHLEELGHARDPYTKKPERYTRPAEARRRDFKAADDADYGTMRQPKIPRLAERVAVETKPRWGKVRRLAKIRRSISGGGMLMSEKTRAKGNISSYERMALGRAI